jgi:hypothetical protein
VIFVAMVIEFTQFSGYLMAFYAPSKWSIA